MSNRRSSSRLETRAQREARRSDATAPRSRRERSAKAPAPSGGRKLPIIQIVVGIAVVGVIAFLVYAIAQANHTDTGPSPWDKAALDSDPKLQGKYYKPNPGPDGLWGTSDDRQHVAQIIPICTAAQMAADEAITDAKAQRNDVANCYNSNPPTSGPHNPNPMPFKVLDNPAPKENLVHNMEHGGVVVWYNTDDPAMIKQLADIVNSELSRKRFVVMSQYTDMEPNTIALTAWTRLDKFSVGDFNKKRVEDFIESYSKRFNPEGF